MGEQRTSCNDGHIGIRWTHPGECPLCACFARIRELEAENARLREAGDRMALLLSRAGTSQNVTIGEEAEWARSAMEGWRDAKRGTHG